MFLNTKPYENLNMSIQEEPNCLIVHIVSGGHSGFIDHKYIIFSLATHLHFYKEDILFFTVFMCF